MNLTSFEYFTAVAKELSFTRAAQQLHTSQQTLSAHIAALEKELGCTLFVRTVPLQLTYGGQRFLHYARRIQEDVSQLRAEFRHMDQKDTGVLAQGISRSNMRFLMMDLISEGAITKDDLEGFSEAFREQLIFYCERVNS